MAEFPYFLKVEMNNTTNKMRQDRRHSFITASEH